MPALDEGHKNVQSKGNNENTCAQPAGYYENTCTPGRHVAHGVEEMVGRTNKTSYLQLQSAEGSRSKWLLIDRCLIFNPFVSTPNTQRLQYNYVQINSIISKQLSVASIYFLFGLGSMALPDFLLHIRLASCSMPRFTSSSSRAALDVWILLCV